MNIIFLKSIPEIRPLPNVPYPPKKTPEVLPNPDKNEPYHPSPEIHPHFNPDVNPEKEKR